MQILLKTLTEHIVHNEYAVSIVERDHVVRERSMAFVDKQKSRL
jgi:hypothetical protein